VTTTEPVTLEEWPDCEWAGCDAKCCVALRSKYCFPHTAEVIYQSALIMPPRDEVEAVLRAAIRIARGEF
jgi:hypothetical protein